MRKHIWLVAVVVAESTVAVRAEPLLLASFRDVGSPSVAPQDEQQVTFALALFADINAPPVPSLGSGTFWEEGETGVMEYTEENNASFGEFSNLATNGRNDHYIAFVRWPDGTGVGAGGPESRLFDQYPHLGEPPDLVGFRLDLVRLIVETVNFEPWNPAPGKEGYTAYYETTYEFYGSPIPDPSYGIALVQFAAIFLGRRVRSVRRS